MVRCIGRGQVQTWMREGAILIEALPAKEYDEEHIVGATNIPLAKMDRRATARIPRDAVVIVYCDDHECDVGPRAAHRLEQLGFSRVFEYTAGKQDWSAAGLPTEGTKTLRPRALDMMHADVAVCRADARVADIADDLAKKGAVYVVDEHRVVQGVIEEVHDPGARAGDAMRLGPSTWRPNVAMEKLAEQIREKRIDQVPITDQDGHLLGVLLREDLEEAS